MNRMICLALALCLMLCACAGAPAQTTAPPETESPAETTTPSADNDMSYQEQDMPIADDPAETEFQAYTHRIEDPDTLIYAGPGFLSGSNWTWRAKPGFASSALAEHILKLTRRYGRE